MIPGSEYAVLEYEINNMEKVMIPIKEYTASRWADMNANHHKLIPTIKPVVKNEQHQSGPMMQCIGQLRPVPLLFPYRRKLFPSTCTKGEIFARHPCSSEISQTSSFFVLEYLLEFGED
mmetsp:Transcript_17165/g.21149  ORF Transcript_17165/g.21149 Transcript_17165/m.21149 type:complete len:119 (+) Transcript_17165:529-885(+)